MTKTVEELKSQANLLGVKFHHRAGAAKIQEAIDLHLATSADVIPTASAEQRPASEIGKVPAYEEPLTSVEYRAQELKSARKRCGELVRIRLQCMNPNKKEWPGEIISVGSAKLGTFKKFIPFNGEPYHVPRIIYDRLCERECSVFFNSTDERGHKTRKGRLIKEFSVEVLEPLTRKEIDDLAKVQSLRGAQG